MHFDEYLAQWSRTHGDAQPTRMIRLWLRIAYASATPFVRIPANTITWTGGLVSIALAVLSFKLQPEAWVVAVGILSLGLLDSIDGIVATRSRTASARGGFLDSVIDRIVDASIAAILLAYGAPLALILLALSLTLIHEYMRARASGLGFTDIGVVTVSEKPTRVAIGVMFFIAASCYPKYSADLLQIASYTWLTLSFIGCVQLARMYSQLIRAND